MSHIKPQNERSMKMEERKEGDEMTRNTQNKRRVTRRIGRKRLP
jgi:hypothetical protein